MRNLKKILALALSLVMMLSVMSVASAKSLDSYTDAASVSAEHEVAVDVATQLGVLQGMTEDTYAPKGNLTRAQLATMIYRITTGDVKGTYVSNFAGGASAKFSDVPAEAWYAGYVAYCADAGYLQGMGDGTYAPNAELTGYQALAALLRAIGYNANNDFTGPDWTVQVAKVATQTGVSAGVLADLNKAITREQAAQFVYNALWTPCVEYTPAFGYTALSNMFSAKLDLAYDVFKVASPKQGVADVTIDDWGRPGTVWFYTNGNPAVVIAEDALAQHVVATNDCTVAAEMGLKAGDWEVLLFVNGQDFVRRINIANDYDVLGGQGVLVEVYGDRIVVIDTFLAQVGMAHPATFDKSGHMVTPAYTDVNIWMTTEDVATGDYLAGVGYTFGEYCLVNVNKEYGYVEYLQPAQTLVGAQTIIWQNAAKHTVAGTTYNDAMYFLLDAADNTASAQFTWFFDQYGNLIGNAAIATVYSYATIKDIQWFNPQSAFGYAQATLVYVDGTTESVVVKSIDSKPLSYTLFEGNPATGAVSANYGYNAAYIGEALYALTKDASGVATLTTVANVVDGANVVTKNPVITNGADYTYVDDSTQFLVRTGPAAYAYSWTTVAGYNLMPTLQNATVYYVNLDADLAAEYAYIYGATSNALAPNLVYVNSLAYAYNTFDGEGNPETVVLKDAYVGGVLTDVVVKYTLVDGKNGNDVVAGHLYYMVDKNADGFYKADEYTDLIGADNVAVGALTAKYVAAGDYTVLNNALQVKDINVPFNITGITAIGGTWTGAENIVVIYSGYTVAAIYVVAA